MNDWVEFFLLQIGDVLPTQGSPMKSLCLFQLMAIF